MGSNFSYPTALNNANGSLSYSFSCNGATFVMLDQFESSDPSAITASSATLGEYGYDTANNTVWAVVNQDGKLRCRCS
jgi:hypothetical protein